MIFHTDNYGIDEETVVMQRFTACYSHSDLEYFEWKD
jgi:hypothetical protein